MKLNNSSPTSIIIFGASGDLTQRKLVPSLFNLFRKGRLPKQFRIVGYGGTAFTDDQFRAHLEEGIKEFASFEYTDEEWKDFASHLVYQQGSYTELADFKKLGVFLKDWEKSSGNRIYYMATPPGVFPNIIDLLGQTDQRQQLGHAGSDFLARLAPVDQSVADVLRNRQVGKQRVGLKDDAEIALRGRQRGYIAAADLDASGILCLQPGDHPQQGGLAAARWAEEADQLARRDGERNIVERRERAEALGDALDAHMRNGAACVHR